MQPIKDKETGLIRLGTRPYKGTGYYAVGHGYAGYGPKPRDIDDINMTMPEVDETAESKKDTWKRMMKAATQKEDFQGVDGNNKAVGSEGFRNLVHQLAENTAMHGLPNATKAKTKERKLFWIAVLIFGMVMIAYHLTVALIKYFNYPVVVTVSVVPSPKQDFPAITFCNINALRKKVVRASSNQHMQSLNTMVNDRHSAGMDAMDNLMTGVSKGYEMMNKVESMSESMQNMSMGSMNASTMMGMMNSMGGIEMDEMNEMMNQTNMANMTGNDVMNMMKERASEMMDDNMMGWDKMDQSCYTESNSAMSMMQSYMEMTSKMTREERQEAGHQLRTMLLDCSWAGRCCSPQNFTTFLNSMYGNCYTFNGDGTKPLMVRKEGPVYGLSLELYVEQDEYMELLTDSAGIRMMIHNQSSMPFPEDQGLSIRPGTKTFVGIKRGEVRMEGHPYSDCKTFSGEQNKKINAFLDEVGTIGYSSDACKKTCYQKCLMKECNCGDNTFPMNASNTAFRNITKHKEIKPCNVSDPQTVSCIRNVEQKYTNNKLGCSCPPSCYQNRYDTQITTADWPTIANENYTAAKVKLLSPQLFSDMHTAENYKQQMDIMRRNVLKVVVFYQSLETTVTQTCASYEEDALLADIGGQVSLWLGLSVVTCFEILEFCGSLMGFSAKKCCRKEKRGKEFRSRSISPSQGSPNSTSNLWYSK